MRHLLSAALVLGLASTGFAQNRTQNNNAHSPSNAGAAAVQTPFHVPGAAFNFPASVSNPPAQGFNFPNSYTGFNTTGTYGTYYEYGPYNYGVGATDPYFVSQGNFNAALAAKARDIQARRLSEQERRDQAAGTAESRQTNTVAPQGNFRAAQALKARDVRSRRLAELQRREEAARAAAAKRTNNARPE